jgi:hypothetical protein
MQEARFFHRRGAETRSTAEAMHFAPGILRETQRLRISAVKCITAPLIGS